MPVARLQIESAPQAVRPGRASPDPITILLSAVLAETLNSCVLAAVTASVANAVLAGQPGCSERMLTQYAPPPPTLFPHVRLKLCMTARTCSAAILLSSYFDRLVFLRDLTCNRIASGTEGAESTSFAAIAKAWRMLAADALEALAEFNRLDVAGSDDESTTRLSATIDLLKRAEEGGMPCVDGLGAVRMPAWAERRATQRVAKNVQAYFMIEKSLQRAYVIDASRNGVCVLGLQKISVGTRVHLLVGPASSIGGKVAWFKDGKAGIALDCELPEDSQLLKHLH